MPFYVAPLADLKPGDRVSVPTRPRWGTLEVLRVDDPGLVLATLADGTALRVGRARRREYRKENST